MSKTMVFTLIFLNIIPFICGWIETKKARQSTNSMERFSHIAIADIALLVFVVVAVWLLPIAFRMQLHI